jgi:hypothetical protein
VIFSILRRYVTRSGGCAGPAPNVEVMAWAGPSGRMAYDIEALAGSRRNEIAGE